MKPESELKSAQRIKLKSEKISEISEHPPECHFKAWTQGCKGKIQKKSLFKRAFSMPLSR